MFTFKNFLKKLDEFQLTNYKDTYGRKIFKIFNGRYASVIVFTDKYFYLCTNGCGSPVAFENRKLKIRDKIKKYKSYSEFVDLVFQKTDSNSNKFSYSYKLTEFGTFLIENEYVTMIELTQLYIDYISANMKKSVFPIATKWINDVTFDAKNIIEEVIKSFENLK